MTSCQWAACSRPSAGLVDGWEMCPPCKRLHQALEREQNPRPPHRKPVPRANCGTPSGYRRHYKLGEKPCEQCRTAEAARRRLYRRAKAPRQLVECGTASAARRHQARGEDLCEPCREAQRVYDRERKQLQRAMGAA